MMATRNRWQAVAIASLALGALIGYARAEDKANPTGTWKWSFTNQQGQSFDLTLRLKLDGDKLSGTLGRGERETAVEDATFKDNEVSFRVTRERNGQKFTSKYQGKLSGDTIKGKVESDFGGQARSRDWEAKRAADAK